MSRSDRRPSFALPSPPAGHDALVRIVDPTGDAIAWFAAGDAFGCVGFAVRDVRTGDWRWTVRAAQAESITHPWNLVERDPASCRLRCEVDDVIWDLTAALRGATLTLHWRTSTPGPVIALPPDVDVSVTSPGTSIETDAGIRRLVSPTTAIVVDVW